MRDQGRTAEPLVVYVVVVAAAATVVAAAATAVAATVVAAAETVVVAAETVAAAAAVGVEGEMWWAGMSSAGFPPQ